MTTEQDDNLRFGLLHPDVVHGMWRKMEPYERKIELHQDFLAQNSKYKAKEISHEDYIHYLYKTKNILSKEEVIIGNTIEFLYSVELRERTFFYLESLRKQLIKVKDELYNMDNRKLLKDLKEIAKENVLPNRKNIYKMQADEAIWLLMKDSIYQVKSKTADLLYDLHWLYTSAMGSMERIDFLEGKQIEAIHWWLELLGLNTEYVNCNKCKSQTLKQFDFCCHCYQVL